MVVTADETGDRFERQVVYGSTLRVSEGDRVKRGDLLTEGSVEPTELLAVKGELAVQDYLIQEVQRVYALRALTSTTSILKLSCAR